jgi:purine-binding chemotaxis protein CheW
MIELMTNTSIANRNLPLEKGNDSHTFCTFRLGGDLFGADTLVVKEVTPLPPMTPIPHAASAVRGYVNLRGQIFLVLDLNCLLGRNPTQIGVDTRLVVFRPDLGDPFGVLVDCIGDIVTLRGDQIEQHPSAALAKDAEIDMRYDEELIMGIGKLDRELLSILNARQFLPCVEKSMRNSLRKQ